MLSKRLDEQTMTDRNLPVGFGTVKYYPELGYQLLYA